MSGRQVFTSPADTSHAGSGRVVRVALALIAVSRSKYSASIALEDAVTELNGEGTDTLAPRAVDGLIAPAAGFTLTLDRMLENLDLSATGLNAIGARGNTAANVLTGNGAANTLNGDAFGSAAATDLRELPPG